MILKRLEWFLVTLGAETLEGMAILGWFAQQLARDLWEGCLDAAEGLIALYDWVSRPWAS